MFAYLKLAIDDASVASRSRIISLYAFLLAINCFAWTWAIVALSEWPALLATALLAYVLGLRHAVDADHIATIDNVVRKLMQDGRHPLAVGLFFALGHSLSVAVAVAAIAAAALALQSGFLVCRAGGSIIATGASA
ncbi:HoxN/HupN/NixA family nickel/cobalt transporter, partial [Bradyrhizobium sp. UFLA 03-164]|nr:HoxN/HupN/NixA family nickel/cobalt transporter [Bradyrhizobium uaiense]